MSLKINDMISQLMKANAEQEHIIETQAAIIDELFVLLCNYATAEEMEGFEALFNSIHNIARKEN